ncbi:MAG: hypothetical protein E6J62_14535 [Deltaproteobacteria bacterium]|nr:MAG: hypothetical protein E6J62_14535 [Deltaproteobacteria bacterium]TMB32116.1 MAG: hypothetical protein E6J61_08170 [Deltaproteobacteria bacterium]
MNALALIVAFALFGVPAPVRRDPALQATPPRIEKTPQPGQREPGTPAQPAPGRPGSQQPARAAPVPAPAPQPPPVPPRRYGRFDLDLTKEQLARVPDLRECAEALRAPSGHAECTVPRDPDRIVRVQTAWEDSRPGGEVVALRLLFDPAVAPALTDLEWQLTRGWGAPVLEQLRREKDQKILTLQWEDAEHRATLEAQGALTQPSRAVAIVLERRQPPLAGELLGLHPRPFPGFRIKVVRRMEWDGRPYALVWGTSLTPLQEAIGESGPAWASQRSYIGLWRLEPSTAQRPRRWRAMWERAAGGDDDDDSQRVSRVETRDLTGDGSPDVEVELSCPACGRAASEVLVKTVRAGKPVDLLVKRDLFRAQVELSPGTVRIREPEGEDDEGSTVSTYAYDRGKGAFVLAREERVARPLPPPEEQ